jgi:hypothetical protein
LTHLVPIPITGRLQARRADEFTPCLFGNLDQLPCMFKVVYAYRVVVS